MSPFMHQAMALAAVALVGYLFGKIGRRKPDPADQPDELRRATQVAMQLESIADELRNDLASHRAKVERFKRELAGAADSPSDEEAWRRLEELAEEMMGPTLQLGGQLSGAYDKIRRQTQSLAHFTGGRLDRQTGLGNSRALDEHLALLLEGESCGFSLAMLSTAVSGEQLSGPDSADRLGQVAELLRGSLRQNDFAARYGVDEIVVVMLDTPLDGARVFGDRFRDLLDEELCIEVCCGLAESLPGDTPKSVLSRADSALYSARAAGPGRQFAHHGDGIGTTDPTAIPV